MQSTGKTTSRVAFPFTRAATFTPALTLTLTSTNRSTLGLLALDCSGEDAPLRVNLLEPQ